MRVLLTTAALFGGAFAAVEKKGDHSFETPCSEVKDVIKTDRPCSTYNTAATTCVSVDGKTWYKPCTKRNSNYCFPEGWGPVPQMPLTPEGKDPSKAINGWGCNWNDGCNADGTVKTCKTSGIGYGGGLGGKASTATKFYKCADEKCGKCDFGDATDDFSKGVPAKYCTACTTGYTHDGGDFKKDTVPCKPCGYKFGPAEGCADWGRNKCNKDGVYEKCAKAKEGYTLDEKTGKLTKNSAGDDGEDLVWLWVLLGVGGAVAALAVVVVIVVIVVNNKKQADAVDIEGK